MVASRRRLTAVFALLFAVAAFPILASAATADFRVLIDNLPDVGCNEGGMTGVDTILVTRAVTTDTSAQETRIYRQVCTAGVFGPPVDLDLTVRPAGLQTPSGLVLLETRIPYSAVPGIETRSIHVGFDATDGFFTQHVLTQPNGSPIMIPPPVGRRHSANTPGSRNFVLDGNGNDWNNIAPLVTGMASDGATAVRMLRVFAVANTTDDFIYFRFDSFVDNSGPFAQDDSFARKSGQGLAVNAPGVLGNDGDPNGKPLTATPVSTPSHGNVVLNPDGSFTYTPDNPTSDTTDKFNYKANNGTKDSNVAEVTIKVSNKNSSAPIANDDAYNTPEDTPLNVAAPGVLANDVDADGPALTATLLTNPSHGSVVLSSNGAFTYNPAHNFFGTDTFTYRVSDGTSNDDAIVTITIGSVNDAPVAQNLSRTTNEEVPVSVTLSATDPEGSALTWQIVSPPTNGVLSGVAPNLTYTPNPNFFGTDTFTYTAKDSSNKVSNTATVTITVNPVNDAPSFSCGPSVIADSSLGAASFPGWATGMSPGPANESSQTLTFEVTANSNPGLFTAGPAVSANGTLTFTPVAGATGTANITLRVRDSGGTANGGVDVSGTCSFTINVDASPTVQSTTPANGAAGVTLNSNVTITFSEPVTVAGTWFSIACATSGTHDTGNSGVSGGATTFTINPTDFTQGESCTATVFASQVTDNDVTDPPNNMAANYVFTFSVDAQPTVTSTTPLNGAVGVPLNSNVTIAFSEPVNAAGTWFQISCSASGLHDPSNSAVSGGPATFTINPTDFTENESCTATVFAANITDVDSNDPPDAMAANYVFSFSIDAAPTVTATTPTNGSFAQPDTDLTVTFSEPVSVTASSFTISCGTSGSHTFALSGGPTTWTLNPNVDFTAGESCTITVLAAQVSDSDTNDPPDNMLANYVFTVGFDAPPSVQSTTPANGATGVPSNSDVTVNFSENVTLSGNWFQIVCGTSGTHDTGNSSIIGGPLSYTINPTDFTQGESCTATIFAADVADNDANDPPDNIVANYVFSFTIDAAPSVTSTTPANGAVNRASNTNITVNFDEPVNANGSAFTISCTVSGAHPFALGGGPSSFSLDPTTDFTEGETCTVTVVAAQVTDVDANDPPDNMLADYVFSFSIDAAPSVTAVTPTNGSVTVATNTNLTVTFSEPVTITNSSVTVSCANTGAHTVSVSGGPTTWTVDPASDFGNGELCTATVFAAQVSDNDSNDPPDNMLANFVWTFTTDNPPSVTATTPANAGTTSLDGNVTVTFDEAVNAAASSFTISCTTSGAHTFALSGGPTTFTLDPTTDFTGGETCTVTVVAAQVTDQDAGDPPDNMVSDYVFSFGIDAAPAVTTTTPTNGAPQVAADTNVTINFSEQVNAAGASFDVTCATSGAHTFTTSASPNTTFTLNPNADFTQGETCTVTVFAAGITDTDAFDPPDNMAANYVFSFTVDAAPSVSSTTPANGATDRTSNTNVTINFDESVNAAGASFDITCGTSGAHTFTTSASPSASFTLDPNTDFTPGETCTVTVFAAGITDADLVDPPDNMLANYVFSFTIDAAPSVTAVTPTNGSVTVATNTNLSVTFSEPVTITNSSVTVSCANTGAHTVTVSGGPTTWTVDPNTDFGNGELCTATVLAAQVSDNDSNDPPDNMLANFVWSFTTDNPPSVTATTPTNASTTSPDTNVTVTFDEAVNAAASSFTISCTTSGAHTFALSGGPTTFTLDPTTDFTGGETCTVTVVAAQVTDQDAGDPPDNMVSDYVFSFGVDAAPAVTTTTPTNGAPQVAANTNVTINFSESVNASGSSFTISCATSGSHTFTTSASPSTTFTLNPNVDFTFGELCTVTVVAAQVTDTDAFDPPDNMPADYVFSFTVDAAPTVTATTPTNGATNQTSNTNVTVTFSEPVNATGASFTISCATSGAHAFALSGGPTTWTLDPTVDFTAGETCTVTALAAQITDTDAFDPPDNMVGDYVFTFSIDAAPSVTAVTPTNGSTNVATNTNLSVTFSEPVTITNSSVTISCVNTGAHTVTVSGGPTTWTVDPNTDFGNSELCTATVLAAQVSDNDANDPPDNMLANFVWSFTTDNPPSVTATTPTNASTTFPSTNVTVTFDEAVNATASSFTISCTTSGSHSFALSGGPTTFTLDPTTDFTGGETCTVTVVAAQVTDQDAGDPPDNMLANYVFSFSVDAAPTVTSTTPTNGAPQAAANTNITVNFSESVNASGSSFTISCASSGSHTFTTSASPSTTFTLNPNVDFTFGELCTVTVVAAQVTDTDAFDPPDNMPADYVFSFTVDAAPTVTATTPTNAATNQTSNTNVTVTFSEPVNATGASFTISCATSGAHAFALSGGPTTWTLDPTVDFTAGETCTVTALAAQITDTDAFDPPDNMVANYVFTFSIDAAPSVTSTTPVDLATQQANNTNVTVTFSEPVNATGASFTISCATSGAHAFALSGGPTTWTLDPNTDFTNGENCTVTVLAAQVTDTDANDPPDNMAANYVFTFTVDTPPSVTTTVPVNGATGVTPSSTITVNFNESVNATTSSFTINCGGAQAFTLSSSPSNTFTLTPTSNLPAVLCTVTVVAAQITDADAGDPPDNMIADFVFSFTVNTPPTANDDVDNAIGNLTLTVPDNDGVLVNGNDGSGADTDPDPGATLAVQGLGPFTGSAGGTITFTAGGGYTYHSEAGDQNVDDVFTYTVVDNNGATDTGQLTIHVGPRYLFVDASFAGSPKDGRDTNPFQTLQQAETGSAANDTFVVKQGAYTDFITLKNGQIMYGNGASATLTTTFNTELFTIFTPTGTHPTFKRSTAGNTITLASGNTLRGIDVSASSGGAAIAGTNFGTLTVSETRIGVGQTNPMPALVLDNGTLAATFQTVNSTAGLNGISLTTCAGNLTVSAGTLTGATGDEFLITGNTPTVNVNFSGNITYAGANSAIRITSTAGTYNGNVTFDTGALNVTGGTAINISAFAAGSTGTHNYYTTSGTATINGAVTGINLGANADGTYTFGPPATPANFAITNTTGTSFLISGNAAKATYRGNITQGNAQTMVGITNHAATGTATFSVGTLNSTAGTGVSLSNADGTENFSGTATLNGATGITITNGTGGAVTFGSGTSITAAGAPFVLDGTATAVTGVITYGGTINRTNGNGTLLNINTLSTPGSLTFSGTTLTGSTNAAPGWVVSIQNITGTVTTNHLNIADSSGSFGGTMVSIGGTNTGALNFHHMILSASGTGAGMVATAASGGTLSITATGGNSSIATANGVGLSLNGQAITNGSILNSLTVTGGASTVNGLSMTNVTGGTFTITGGSLAGATGATFNVSGGSVSVTYGGTITQANAAAAISVAGGHSGTLTFNGNVSATNGTGLQFDNADGTYNLHGTTTTMNGGNAGVDILNGSGGTFDFTSGTSITNPTGAAFVVTASSPSITYAGPITQNTAGQRAIDITTLGGGTSLFSGAIGSTGGAGVSIEGTAGTVNISGQLTLSGAASVFKACSGTCAVPAGTGLTVTASNANNTVGSPTAATATGITINRAQIGGTGVQFDVVNVTGGTNGILLSNTGNTAGFTINGTGAADSGGTLQNQTGDAISINSVRSVTLNEMQITNAGDNGIDATSVTNGFTIDSCDFATTANTGILGNNLTDFKYQNSSTMTGAGNAANEYGIFITDLLGTSAITNSSVTGSAVINVFITNNSSTAGTLTISNSTLNQTAAATGGDGVSIVGNNSSNLTLNMTGNNNLNNNQGDGLQVSGNNSATLNVTVTGTGSNYNANLGSAVNIAAANSANITALVTGFTGVSTGTSSANGLNVINIQNFDTSTINAKVISNTITGLGNNAAGIRLIQEGNGTINADVHSNSISGMGAEGIRGQARAGTGGAGHLNLTIGGAGVGNTVNDAAGFPLDGISFESGSSAGGDTNTVCLNMASNNSSANAAQGYRLRQRTGTTFNLQSFGTSPCGANGANSADVQCWINTTKTNTGTSTIVIGTAFSNAPSNCPTPP